MAKYDLGGHEVKQDPGGESINLLDQNKTLVVESLTSDPPIKPEVATGLTTISEVFEHYQPQVEVEFTDGEGAPINNTLHFRSIADFGKKGVIDKSEFLQDLEASRVDYQKFVKMLNVKQLGNILKDPDAKAAYLNALKALAQELEGSI